MVSISTFVGVARRVLPQRVVRTVRSFRSGFEAGYRRAKFRGTEDIARAERTYERKVIRPVSRWIGGRKAEEYEKRRAEIERHRREGKTWTAARERRKLKELKPHPVRQFARGAVETAVAIPLFPLTIARVSAEAVKAPKKMPARAVAFGKGMAEHFKEEPYRAAGGIAAMVALPYAKRVAKPVGVRVSKLSPRYIPARRITPMTVVKEKMPSTFRKPIMTSAGIMKREMEVPTFKLTGRPEEVWHAAPTRWKPSLLRGEIEARAGKSPVKGVYVAPAPYPKFAGLGGVIESTRRIPTRPTRPTFYSIMTRGIEVPKRARVGMKEVMTAKKLLGRGRIAGIPERVRRFAGYKRWVEEKAPRGKAYVSPEVTAKIPWRGELEVEAVIPHGTKFVEPLKSRILPKFTYVKRPRYRLSLRGRRELLKLQRKWKPILRKFPEKAKKFEEMEAELLRRLKGEGELKFLGYETAKVKVRRLVAPEVGGEVKFGKVALKERVGKIPEAKRVREEFRIGEYEFAYRERPIFRGVRLMSFGVRPRPFVVERFFKPSEVRGRVPKGQIRRPPLGIVEKPRVTRPTTRVTRTERAEREITRRMGISARRGLREAGRPFRGGRGVRAGIGRGAVERILLPKGLVARGEAVLVPTTRVVTPKKLPKKIKEKKEEQFLIGRPKEQFLKFGEIARVKTPEEIIKEFIK